MKKINKIKMHIYKINKFGDLIFNRSCCVARETCPSRTCVSNKHDCYNDEVVFIQRIFFFSDFYLSGKIKKKYKKNRASPRMLSNILMLLPNDPIHAGLMKAIEDVVVKLHNVLITT